MLQITNDTIVAPATSVGEGAISIVRLSGSKAIDISNQFFQGKDLNKLPSREATFGLIVDRQQKIIDEVVLTLYRNPKSYTGEDLVEISCHASSYIVKSILKLAIDRGAKMADPGEFTMRAFFNGKMDLSQAEAVADLIASESKASHDIALAQMRGKFSNKIELLRQQLIDFASLLELELDFSEEDVEFADRDKFALLLEEILSVVNRLIDSFKLGNVIKKGVPTVIAGRPNAGKSTLLNVLLQEDRAIVSEIAGTTRDTIEEVMNIEGVLFRFIDTAGIRQTDDVIEKSGVERTMDHISRAAMLLYLFDISEMRVEEVRKDLEDMPATEAKIILIANKMDKAKDEAVVEHFRQHFPDHKLIAISAKKENKVDDLRDLLYDELTGHIDFDNRIIITNTRHLEALERVRSSLMEVDQGLTSGIPSDLVAMDLRQALHYLGTITGAIGTEDLLGNIFGKFCIGK